jgi:alpha-galactosidase
VGYHYVNIDDCYAEKNRTASGDIIPGLWEVSNHSNCRVDQMISDKIRFPNIKAMTDEIHAMGLYVVFIDGFELHPIDLMIL